MNEKQNTNDRIMMILFIFALGVLLIIRDVLSISVNKFIFLIVCSVFLTIANETTRMSMISFLLPLMCGIPSTYILAVIMSLFIIGNRINKTTILLCVFFVLLEIHALAYIDVSFDSDVIKQLLFICVFFSMLYNVEKVNYNQCLALYFIGTLIVSFVIDAYSIIRAPSNWLSLFAKGWYRFGSVALEGVEGMTLHLNPISLGYFCASGVLVGLVLMFNSHKHYRIVVICGVLFLTATAFLAVSRTFVIVIAACALLILLTRVRYTKEIGFITLIVCVTAIIVIEINKKYPELMAGMIYRMTSDSMEGGNGRVELMIEYSDAIFNGFRSALMGVGATHTLIGLNASMSVHNAILQIFASYGIIGGSIFIIAMIYPLFSGREKGNAEFVYWLPFIGTFVYMQTIQFLNPSFHMMAYVMAVYSVKEGKIRNKGYQIKLLR